MTLDLKLSPCPCCGSEMHLAFSLNKFYPCPEGKGCEFCHYGEAYGSQSQTIQVWNEYVEKNKGEAEAMRKTLLEEVSIEEMLQMRESGMTNKEIAEKLDVTPATITRILPKTRNQNKVDPEELRLLAESGMTNREIAEHTGLSYVTVCRHLGRRSNSGAPYKDPKPIPLVETVVDIPTERTKSYEEFLHPEEWVGGMHILSNTARVESATSFYSVDRLAHTVEIRLKRVHTVKQYTKSELEAHIEELMEIVQMMG